MYKSTTLLNFAYFKFNLMLSTAGMIPIDSRIFFPLTRYVLYHRNPPSPNGVLQRRELHSSQDVGFRRSAYDEVVYPEDHEIRIRCYF